MERHRMITWFLSCVMLVLSAAPQRASAQDSALRYFQGGNMELDVSISSRLLTGPGTAAVVGGGTAPAIDDPFAVFRNPAGLRYLYDRPRAGFTLHPSVGIKFSSLPIDVQSTINRKMDNATRNFLRTGPFEYPQFGGTLTQQATSLDALTLTFPQGSWQFGVGFHRPFYYRVNFLFSGLHERIDTIEEDPSDAVAFAIQSKSNSTIAISADTWVLAAARDVGDAWSAGVSLARTYVHFESRSGYRVDGVMVSQGQQYAFNDDSDPWYNKLNGEMTGGYSGSFYTLRLGTQYVPYEENGWRFGAELKLSTNATLAGDLRMVVDEFPALILQAEEGEDNFDVNRIEEVSELTRTYPNRYLTPETVALKVPSSISVGVARGMGIRPKLDLTLYLGSLEYEMEIGEKRVFDEAYAFNLYGKGVRPVYQAYLGISPGWFFLGVGVISLRDINQGHKDGSGHVIADGKQILVPRLDMGFRGRLVDTLSYELLVDGLPEDVLRLGLTYEF